VAIDLQLIEKVITEVLTEYTANASRASGQNPAAVRPGLTSAASREALLFQPQDAAALQRMKQRTNARIGVGKTGARLMTQTLLTLRADHAAARDAVFRDAAGDVVDSLGLFSVESKCANKNEFLTRPDLGRQLSEAAAQLLRDKCRPNPDIQVFAADGLSSTAITANLPDLWPCLLDGLQARGVNMGTPFFVRHGRVGIMDQVAEIVGAKVVCVLLGERPGLATAESMSAYIAYNARVGMEESRRTVVSNIHRLGIPAVEAGAYLAELLVKVLEAKASGVALNREG